MLPILIHVTEGSTKKSTGRISNATTQLFKSPINEDAGNGG